MTRAAVVGCGDISAVHFQAIQDIDGIDLVGVCDTDPQRLAEARERTGVPGFATVEELLAGAHPEVIHVCTPHDQHVDASITALRAGVHVIQEKPVAHTQEEAHRLLEATAELQESLGTAAPKIAICLQNRYNVASVELKRLLESGTLGQVRGAYATVAWSRTPGYYPSRPWRGDLARSGGGVLMNQAPHTLDLIQWFLGPVTQVQGHISTDKFADVSEVEDTVTARFTHSSGATTCFYGTVNLSSHRPVEIEVDCEHAYVTLRDGLTVTWKDEAKHGLTEHWEERRAAASGRSYWGVSHELLIRDFYAHLAAPEPFWISPAEGMACLDMAQAVYAASRSGSAVTL